MSFLLSDWRSRSNAHLRGRITLIKGDITQQADVDAIISTLPLTLVPEGTLNKALFAAAGPKLDAMVLEEIFRPRSGDAYLFPACNMPARYIIFVMTEEWDSALGAQDRDLLRAYRRGIEAAQVKGLKRIAVPSLGTGRHKFPPKRAARLAVQAIMDRLTEALEEVRIVCHTDETHKAFRERLGK